jgi:hypothetical protein
MNHIRAKFEEIWPVPQGVYWRDSKGQYGCDNHTYEDAMDTHNIRLDTFTRCQETQEVATEIIFHASNLLNYVRDKYGVIGDDFSCEHMRGIAAAMKRIKE